MKKIGLMTFHDTANYGAALQLYATLRKIKNFGYEVEVIDYTNRHRSSIYTVRGRLKKELANLEIKSAVKTILGSPIIYSRMKAFNVFYKEHTPRSATRITKTNQLQDTIEEYRAILCGSDQIWSPKNNGSDTNYLLSFLPASFHKFSYASSFGSINIPCNLKEEYSRLLKELKYVSVREKTGREIVNSLSGIDAKVVVDPVFLLSRTEWLSLIGDSVECRKEAQSNLRVLDYTASKSAFARVSKIDGFLSKYSECEKIGTSIGLSDFLTNKVKTSISSGPIDFIKKIYGTDLLITTSFHGTVFAIIFKKQFLCILSGDKGRDSRIADMLEEYGLSDRIFKESTTLADIEKAIDYTEVHKRLELNIKESESYLLNSLKGLE
ncbi:TPA: polysaccharide pyruvyl transferase family protein [Vibrio vulnificus]|nr:polysaccharide pyruvyl transferase family protein [Vibrio vulnificus]